MPIINGNFQAYTYTDNASPALNASEQNAIVQTVEAAQTLRGTGAPTTLTAGVLGQFYVDTSSLAYYVCTSAASPYVWTSLTALITPQILLAAYPIGSIYISYSSTNPTTLFGGTWEAYATGRTLMGIDPNDASFDIVGKLGGAKTHTQTLPTHRHPMAHTHPFSGPHSHDEGTLAVSTSIGVGVESSVGLGTALGITGATAAATVSGTTGSASASYTGYSGALTTSAGSSLPPYIVTYIWRRTA